MNIFDNFFYSNKELITLIIISLLILYFFYKEKPKEPFFGKIKRAFKKLDPEREFKRVFKKAIKPAINGVRDGVLTGVDAVNDSVRRVESETRGTAQKAVRIFNMLFDKIGKVTNDANNFFVKVGHKLKEIAMAIKNAFETAIRKIDEIGKKAITLSQTYSKGQSKQ